jgi:hypothetical protein
MQGAPIKQIAGTFSTLKLIPRELTVADARWKAG